MYGAILKVLGIVSNYRKLPNVNVNSKEDELIILVVGGRGGNEASLSLQSAW